MEIEAALAADLVERQVNQAVLPIQNSFLTLSCPRCDAAFLDYNGCAALTCGQCNAGFCAVCLADCGNDAHAHVLVCPDNPTNPRSYWVTQDQFNAVHREIRQRQVEAYLDTLDADVRARIVRERARDFADTGLIIR